MCMAHCLLWGIISKKTDTQNINLMVIWSENAGYNYLVNGWQPQTCIMRSNDTCLGMFLKSTAPNKFGAATLLNYIGNIVETPSSPMIIGGRGDFDLPDLSLMGNLGVSGHTPAGAGARPETTLTAHWMSIISFFV